MKILFVKNIPSPYRNSFFNELSSKLNLKGIDLEVWYCAQSESNRNWKVDLDEVAYNFRIFKGLHLTIGGYFLHLNVGLLIKLFFVKFDVIVVGGYGTPTLFLVPFVPFMGSRKILWSETNEESTGRKSLAIFWFKKFFIKNFNEFMVPGQRAENFIRNFIDGDENFFQLPNTISDFFGTEEGVNRIRNGKPLKLFISARLEWFKGLKEFLEVVQNDDPLIIYIAGTGSQEGDLRELVKRRGLNVFFLGSLDPEQMVDYYRLADYFVLPSFKDPSPLSCIEALSQGCPLLISNRVGNRPEVLDGNGWEFDITRKDSVRCAIDNALVTSHEDMNNMRIRSVQIYKEKFDVDKVVSNLVLYLSRSGSLN